MTDFNFPTEQVKRQRSAETALSLRQWTFLDTPSGWKVVTPRDTYSLFPASEGPLVCSCPDSQQYRPFGLECKHACGLRIYLEEGGRPRCVPTKSTGGSPMTTEQAKECGWVRLFHPSAAQVTIPLAVNRPYTESEARDLLASISCLLQAGFSVDAPGLEAGEHVEEIGHVVRRAKANSDGTETPVVDLYPARGNFRLLARYLNTPADLQAFQEACGVQLEQLPLYEGDNAIERGKNPKLDRYVAALPHPTRVVWKLNPRYEGEQDKKSAKRLFVRWELSSQTSAARAGMSLEQARALACPLSTRSHPDYKGRPLGEIADLPDGLQVLEYLAGEQYQPNGNRDGQLARLAAQTLLAAMQPAA